MEYRRLGRTGVTVSSLCLGASTVPSDDALDRIDEIVPPGITLNLADNGWVSPALQASARRRSLVLSSWGDDGVDLAVSWARYEPMTWQSARALVADVSKYEEDSGRACRKNRPIERPIDQRAAIPRLLMHASV